MMNPQALSNEVLESYDMMMMGLLAKGEAAADLALELWACVMVELNIRGRVQLLRGSYDDVSHAEIRRLYTVMRQPQDMKHSPRS